MRLAILLLTMAVCSFGQAAWGTMNATAIGSTNCSSSTTTTCGTPALGTAASAGDVGVAVLWGSNSSDNFTSCSDNEGGTWTVRRTQTATGIGAVAVLYRPSLAAGVTSVSCTIPHTGTGVGGIIYDIAPPTVCSTVATTDGGGGSTTGSASGNSYSGPTQALTYSTDLVVQGTYTTNVTAGSASISGSYVIANTGTLASAYWFPATTGSAAVTWTWSRTSSGSYVTVAMAIQAPIIPTMMLLGIGCQ